MEALGKNLDEAEAVRVHNSIVKVIESSQNAMTPAMEQKNWEDSFRKFEEYVVYSRLVDEATSAPYAGADALLYSLITQGWSSYEHLAADLWASTMDAHVDKFLPNITAKYQHITLTPSSKCPYDPKVHPWRFLRSRYHNDLGLDRLRKIGATYSTTFGTSWIPLNTKAFYSDLRA